MTITLELPPDLAARFVAEAEAKGVPVDEVVRAYLYHAPPERSPKQLTAEEVDRGLEEAADLIAGTTQIHIFHGRATFPLRKMT